ncbi:MFS transporter [Demequina zhanjiangensis]|uniref:MFS transporter n=1 Tax=Demequina zhanjiangensis TaxID=3051659 RepID=A0ABT8G475_9MICO|nr:MFS transporter [Demequina sp. SYSU T00b26]MDN4473862.1 MFS transporter [Demequina sp. SYSU T00b26]
MSLRADLHVLWESRGFRRLTWARLLSQGGDGMFQVGIATAFFFDPTQATTPEQIAIGFAVLLAPFTFVGPFVGPLIDRWQRQRILLVGNLIRLLLAGAIVALVLADAPLWTLYGAALLTLSVNRFLLAAMTAGLPQVVPAHQLLAANSVLPTLGTIAASVGGAIGAVATFVVPSLSDSSLAITALLGAALGFGASSFAATRIGHRELGPVHPLVKLQLAAQVRALTAELLEGERYLRARGTPWHALGVMSAQRLLYGVMFVAAILASRHVLADPDDAEAALGAFSIVLGFAAVGFGLAAVLTPLLGDRVSRERWILMCLGVGAVGQALLAIGPEAWTLLTAAVVVSFAVQGGKIAVDTIVQRDTEDHVRGRAFTLYDMAYNVAFMSAAVLGAVILPDNGWSRAVMLGIAVAYLAVAVVYARTPREPNPMPAPATAE